MLGWMEQGNVKTNTMGGSRPTEVRIRILADWIAELELWTMFHQSWWEMWTMFHQSWCYFTPSVYTFISRFYFWGPLVFLGIRCVSYPVNLVKTRLMVQTGKGVYRGSADAFRKVRQCIGYCLYSPLDILPQPLTNPLSLSCLILSLNSSSVGSKDWRS